jgi:hypothetical protein
LLVNPDQSVLRAVDPADDIEQRTFAGAIRTDDRADFSGRDGEINVLQRRHSAEC